MSPTEAPALSTASTITCIPRIPPMRRSPSFDELPTEILERIMGLSNGPGALYQLVQASANAQATFVKRPYSFIISAVYYSPMDVQLQQIYGNIISIRHLRRFHVADESLRANIMACLNDHFTTVTTGAMLKLEPASPLKPLEMLRDAWSICDAIVQAERSFVKTQLPSIAAKTEDKIARGSFYQVMLHPSSMKVRESQESPTELHRISRAFWRLRLYSEAFYEPFLRPLAKGSERQTNLFPQFLSGLADYLLKSVIERNLRMLARTSNT